VELHVGQRLFAVEKFSTFVNFASLNTKGTDSSKLLDEEVEIDGTESNSEEEGEDEVEEEVSVKRPAAIANKHQRRKPQNRLQGNLRCENKQKGGVRQNSYNHRKFTPQSRQPAQTLPAPSREAEVSADSFKVEIPSLPLDGRLLDILLDGHCDFNLCKLR